MLDVRKRDALPLQLQAEVDIYTEYVAYRKSHIA